MHLGEKVQNNNNYRKIIVCICSSLADLIRGIWNAYAFSIDGNSTNFLTLNGTKYYRKLGANNSRDSNVNVFYLFNFFCTNSANFTYEWTCIAEIRSMHTQKVNRVYDYFLLFFYIFFDIFSLSNFCLFIRVRRMEYVKYILPKISFWMNDKLAIQLHLKYSISYHMILYS